LFAQFSQRYFAELDTTMRGVVDSLADAVPGLDVMVRYPMGWVDQDNLPYDKPTGKRIRPMLLLLCTEAAGGDWHTALPAAAAVELLHNFSLIHDDIQDSSPIRHGRPTVWKIWGFADAINAGDALFGLAYKALHGLADSGVEAGAVLKIWQIFNATVLDLTRGQFLDMSFEHRQQVTTDEYISMISGKSAALLAACTQIGAMIPTGDESLAGLYGDFGRNLGIAFQIRDDILGIWGDPNVTGKSAATDILSRKKTLPVLYALSHSTALADIYQREDFGEGDVSEAVAILDSLDTRSYAREQERYYYEQAVAAIEAAHPVEAVAQGLRLFLDKLFGRSY
jgi:geranylgeranyl diphosphate synthase type I